jgi:hypothetical protein
LFGFLSYFAPDEIDQSAITSFDSSSSFQTKTSLCCEPNNLVPSNPDPNSKPLVAGNDNIAIAKTASVFSNHGSPIPFGTFLITPVAIPPIESLSSLTSLIFSIILIAVGI